MNKVVIKKDPENKRIVIEREFEAQSDAVWDAWTKSELLEQWWAPKPWKSVTKSFEFKDSGHWHYYMVGPDGTKFWSWIGYEKVDPKNSFSAQDAFCDENGNLDTAMTSTLWLVEFFEEGGKTKVKSTLSFDSEAAMNKIIEMGFEEGFSMGLGNLEELLARM